MHNGKFVFDNVVHMYDNTASNVIDPVAMHFQEKFHETYSRPGMVAKNYEGSKTTVEEALHYLFEASDTDMAMAQTVPLFSYWREGFAPASLQHALATACPERVLFCGGVDPVFHGVSGAQIEMERQVVEWNAVSMKFYQGHARGLSWRADDRAIAYPLWEKCQELGIKCVQFHKGIPLGYERVEDLAPNDLQVMATDFPDLDIIIHHFGLPYVDITINIAARFPNVHMSLSALLNLFPVAPWTVYEALGKALLNVGEDRLIYGSEAFAWPAVQAYIDALGSMQIPEELQDRYGYPEITETTRAKILGQNFARLMGIDVEAKLAELGELGTPTSTGSA
jgi:predicted TIM-barrel fold metal-dependent hydrolase